jgi:hypothetical protein
LSPAFPPPIRRSGVRPLFSSGVGPLFPSPVRFRVAHAKTPRFLGAPATCARSSVRAFATRNVTPPSFNCTPKRRTRLTGRCRIRIVCA